jgi:hypothetical protein
LSQKVAYALHTWIPYVIQTVKPFLSSGGDISKGERWGDVLVKELQDAQYGIICVTPYNLYKPWMNFEAGVLSKFIDQSAVAPFLFGVDQSALLSTPLSQFQSTAYSAEDVFSLVSSINKRLGPLQVDHEVLRRTFDVWWKDLKEALDHIGTVSQGETRTEYEWLLTSEDLINEFKADYKSVWIVTLDIFRRAITEDLQALIKDKVQSGVKYTYFLRETDDHLQQLKQIADASQGNLACKILEPDIFDRYAVTDYILFNVDPDMSRHLRVFFKLPAEHQGCEYWVKVDELWSTNFKTRFGHLLDREAAEAIRHQVAGAT